MAGSLLLLLDDIASALDDVAAMTKAAAAKTSGVIGDDLALNAKQLAGVAADRELAVVAAVARGSAVNKLLLVPAALALGWWAPGLVQPLLLLGGAYLCFEGVEKVIHRLGTPHGRRPNAPGLGEDADASAASPAASERERIRGAVRTDFILSAEIIVITLGVVAGQPLAVQVAVLAAVAVGMTVVVYGLVAAIVKLDDVGVRLAAARGPGWRALGRSMVAAAPLLLRVLAVAGTAAMFLVGGGIVVHALPAVHGAVHELVGRIVGVASWRPWIEWLGGGAVGVATGCLACAAAAAVRLAWPRPRSPAA